MHYNFKLISFPLLEFLPKFQSQYGRSKCCSKFENIIAFLVHIIYCLTLFVFYNNFSVHIWFHYWHPTLWNPTDNYILYHIFINYSLFLTPISRNYLALMTMWLDLLETIIVLIIFMWTVKLYLDMSFFVIKDVVGNDTIKQKRWEDVKYDIHTFVQTKERCSWTF